MTLNQFIYRMSRPLGGLKLAKFLSRNHPKILMYHRITEDPKGEGLTADQFRQQVRIIKRDFVPMTLRDLLKAHENGKVPENAVVVTFDDGYADFAEVAFPILEAEGIPATLFVTTGFVNGDIWLWPDQIKYALDNSELKSISLKYGTKFVNSDEKRRAWNEIANYCLTISNKEKIKLIEDVYDQLQIEMPEVAPQEFRPITWLDLRTMVAKGLDVGSHSITHPILTKVEGNELFKELIGSRLDIEKNLDITPESFCFPNGQLSDFDDEIKKAVKECGYKCGVSAFSGRNTLSDMFSVNRYSCDSSLDSFEKAVYGFTFIRDALFVRF